MRYMLIISLIGLVTLTQAQYDSSSHDNDHSNHHDDSHAHHTMADSSPNSLSQLGAYPLTVEPLITLDDQQQPQFSLYVAAQDSTTPPFRCTVTSPSGVHSQSVEGSGQQPCLLASGLEPGHYQLAIVSDDATLMQLLALHADTSAARQVYSIFSPAPSLASAGKTELFVYAFDNEGKNIHGEMHIRYAMEGMQHSSDDASFPLEHRHLDNTYMTNYAALSFAMAGDWQSILTIHEEPIRFVVEVLADTPNTETMHHAHDGAPHHENPHDHSSESQDEDDSSEHGSHHH